MNNLLNGGQFFLSSVLFIKAACVCYMLCNNQVYQWYVQYLVFLVED